LTSDLLATKLHRPAVSSGRIPRPHLVRRLNEGLTAGRTLTLFSAPAGFGKTTCAGEWLDTLDRPIAWLTLEDADDDPGRFFLYLIAAFQKVDSGIGREIDGILRAGSLPPAGIIHTTLSNDILELDQSFILVLDDFQVIQDYTILQVVDQLVVNPPPPLHIVLLTREDPPLPLAKLRANDKLSEIRAADLRFSPDEAGQLLRGALGLNISAEDIVLLDERTEGWAAGLHLAGLSIRGRADPSSFISSLSGGHRHILEYLTEEVLNRQTPADQEFLLQTSLLERLSGGLCDAITGRETLDRLYRANLFLVPLDDEGRWYRYHQLFVGMLQDRCKTLPAEITAEFHRRASGWFAREGMAGEAVRHALAARDYAAAVIQIETHAMDMLMQWHVKTVDGWMRSIPAGWSAGSIRANLAFAWIHMIRGEPLRAAPHLERLQALFAESRHAELSDSSLNAKWLAIQAMMLNARGLAAEGLAIGRKALAIAPETDSQVRCLVHLAIAGSCDPLDDTPGMENAFAEIIRYGREGGNSVYELLGISGLALSAIKHGRLHFAYEYRILYPVRGGRWGGL
jgi:LuxR family maltose regulon positive regulatory protein